MEDPISMGFKPAIILDGAPWSPNGEEYFKQQERIQEEIRKQFIVDHRSKYKVVKTDGKYFTGERIADIQKLRSIDEIAFSLRDAPRTVWADVKETGNITAVTLHDSEWNKTGYIKRIDKDHYMDERLGEVKEYNHIAENRSQNAESIRRTIAQLRDVINCNTEYWQDCKWITLTYAENMTDRERLMNDCVKFFKKLDYYCKSHSLPKFEYISVVEPQSRGAWHAHIILIFDGKAPYIDNAEVAKMWGQGFTKTKACNESDNLGAYLSAYLSDMPVDDENGNTDDEAMKIAQDNGLEIIEKQFKDDKGAIKSKRFIKGARLYMYPNGMKLYRCSKGVKRPVVSRTRYDDIKEKIPEYGSETFSQSYALINTTNGAERNHLQKTFYNKARNTAKQP